MREIKFRGRDIDTREFVYAELGQVSEEIRQGYLTFLSDDGIYTVYAESVAQLVGYDKDGKEVYEGDVLYRDFNGVHYEYEVRLFGDAVAENGCYITEKMFREMQVKAA